jgi:hypothetical protein
LGIFSNSGVICRDTQQNTKGFFMFVCFHLTIFFSSEEDDDDVDITEAELNALPFSDQDDDSDQGLYNIGWFKKQFSPCLLGLW